MKLVKPDLKSRVEAKQQASKYYHDKGNLKNRTFDLYQQVLVKKSIGFGKFRWIPGVIVEVKGHSTYLVRMMGNVRRYVHADQLMVDDSRSIVNRSIIDPSPLLEDTSDDDYISTPDINDSIPVNDAPQSLPTSDQDSPIGSHIASANGSPISIPNGSIQNLPVGSPGCLELPTHPGTLSSPVPVRRSNRPHKPKIIKSMYLTVP